MYCDICKKPVKRCECWFRRMRYGFLPVLVVLALAGVAYASAVYTIINSNGGASLSGEASKKKAALRCAMMQWPNTTWNCPDGTQCTRTGGSGQAPNFASVSNCIDGPMLSCGSPIRQCNLHWSGNGWTSNADQILEYAQCATSASYWGYATAQQQAQCTFSNHRLEVWWPIPRI